MALYKQHGSQNWWISIYRGRNYKRLRISSGTSDREQARAIEASLRRAQNNPGNAEPKRNY